ncbi:MAG: protein-tyrosine phosphatase, partial [Verrucomicrobiales bacterium]
MKMPIEDFGTPGDTAEFKQAMDTLKTAHGAGRNVLIHCAAGVGRSRCNQFSGHYSVERSWIRY